MLPIFVTNYNDLISLLATHKLYEYFVLFEEENGSIFI